MGFRPGGLNTDACGPLLYPTRCSSATKKGQKINLYQRVNPFEGGTQVGCLHTYLSDLRSRGS